MITRFPALLFLAAFLGGCASTGALYQRAEDETFESTKPLAQVSSCLQLLFASAPITTPGGETTFIAKNGYQLPMGLVTLTASGTGTHMALRRANSLAAIGNWRGCG